VLEPRIVTTALEASRSIRPSSKTRFTKLRCRVGKNGCWQRTRIEREIISYYTRTRLEEVVLILWQRCTPYFDNITYPLLLANYLQFRTRTNNYLYPYEDLYQLKLFEFHRTIDGLFSCIYGSPICLNTALWENISGPAPRLQILPLASQFLEKAFEELRSPMPDGWLLKESVALTKDRKYQRAMEDTHPKRSSPETTRLPRNQSGLEHQGVREGTQFKRSRPDQEAMGGTQPRRLRPMTSRLPYKQTPSLSSASMSLTASYHSGKKRPGSVGTVKASSSKANGTLSSGSMDLSTTIESIIESFEYEGVRWPRPDIDSPASKLAHVFSRNIESAAPRARDD
jgi:hypothetical protein